jgi:hypothetical protein
MFTIGIKDVVAVMAAAVALSWWLSRQAQTGKLADQGIDLARRHEKRHAAFARRAGRCDYERFSKFRLN